MNGLTDFTISLWINFEQFKSPSAVFSVANRNSDNMLLFFHNSIYFQKLVRSPAANEKCNISLLKTLNKWYHVAITRDTSSKTLTFYYYGVQKC